jgi:GNAT superfamily N-acetyltransferase
MIAYRQATEADAPAVISLLEEIMEHHGVHPPARERLASIVSRIIAAPDHCFLLAESSEDDPAITASAETSRAHVVGMCGLLFTLSTWSAAPVCELQDVVVTEAQRRGEVGRGLMAAAADAARERGCARLQLLAESWNLAGHAFYRSLGLAEKTCLYFERDLTGGDTG